VNVRAISKNKHWMIDLHDDCNEGMDGDYRGPDCDDIPLLRFDAHRRKGKAGPWQEVDDGSYCTQIPADISKQEIRRLAAYLAEELAECGSLTDSNKRLCEGMSWINPTWGTPAHKSGWTLDAELERRQAETCICGRGECPKCGRNK
jgi:hypothetical protein